MIVDAHGQPITSTLNPDEAIAQMAIELETCVVPMELVLRPFTALQLAGLLQLVQRHPELSDPHRAIAASVVEAAREYFADCPTVLAILDAGDDLAQDVPRGSR